jgi:hypothetical protein
MTIRKVTLNTNMHIVMKRKYSLQNVLGSRCAIVDVLKYLGIFNVTVSTQV